MCGGSLDLALLKGTTAWFVLIGLLKKLFPAVWQQSYHNKQRLEAHGSPMIVKHATPMNPTIPVSHWFLGFLTATLFLSADSGYSKMQQGTWYLVLAFLYLFKTLIPVDLNASVLCSLCSQDLSGILRSSS